MSMYSQKVMDHFSNPRNVGELKDADGVGEVGNAKCGDIMKIFLKVENGVIEDVKFQTFGCGAAIATSSMVTEMVKGKKLEEALQISNELSNEYNSNPQSKEIIDTAMLFEGMPKNSTTHAAGVIISGVPITDIAPLSKNDDNKILTELVNELKNKVEVLSADVKKLTKFRKMFFFCRY